MSPLNARQQTVTDCTKLRQGRLPIFMIVLALVGLALHGQAHGEDPSNVFLGLGAGASTNDGFHNTAIGAFSLNENISGNANTALGTDALENSTVSNLTAIGYHALQANTTGVGNTAVGFNTLTASTTGYRNTAIGDQALLKNTVGAGNTANGANALQSNTSGYENTATGDGALYQNTIGDYNAAHGDHALFSNTYGSANTASGSGALAANTGGHQNTAAGFQALVSNLDGDNNTAMGNLALKANTHGGANTAVGRYAMQSNTTGSGNIAVGYRAGFRLTNGGRNIDIDIGNEGVAGESDTIRIGATNIHQSTFVAGISGATVANGVGVVVSPSGKLGTVVSSRRFKDQIKPMANASEALLALQPVTFQYKEELDGSHIPQFGLIAEDVAKISDDLVARNDNGEIYSVRYEAVNAMLLNEFLKEHRAVQDQQGKIARLTEDVAQLAATVRKQTAEMQKRSGTASSIKAPRTARGASAAGIR